MHYYILIFINWTPKLQSNMIMLWNAFSGEKHSYKHGTCKYDEMPTLKTRISFLNLESHGFKRKTPGKSNPKICISIGSFFIGPLAGDTLQLEFPGVLQVNVNGSPCIAKLWIHKKPFTKVCPETWQIQERQWRCLQNDHRDSLRSTGHEISNFYTTDLSTRFCRISKVNLECSHAQTRPTPCTEFQKNLNLTKSHVLGKVFRDFGNPRKIHNISCCDSPHQEATPTETGLNSGCSISMICLDARHATVDPIFWSDYSQVIRLTSWPCTKITKYVFHETSWNNALHAERLGIMCHVSGHQHISPSSSKELGFSNSIQQSQRSKEHPQPLEGENIAMSKSPQGEPSIQKINLNSFVHIKKTSYVSRENILPLVDSVCCLGER